MQEEGSFNSSDVLAGTQTTWLHVDHLNTPRVGTDDTQTIAWRWDSDPFGVGAADPDNDSTHHVVLLRLPGQYEDEESGHDYNYVRDYDPANGPPASAYVFAASLAMAGVGGALVTWDYATTPRDTAEGV